MNINFRKKVEKHIDNGFVSKRKHPEEKLWILNYTPKTQYDWKWNDVTIKCRGLIVDENYKVIQRPFCKFFNFDQYNQMKSKVGQLFKINLNKYNMLDREGFASVKEDGSLGILYWIKDKPFIATRGSFESEQAVLGTKLIQEMSDIHHLFNKSLTYLFEITSPKFRIVKEYVSELLYPIATINTSTGRDDLEALYRVFWDDKTLSGFYSPYQYPKPKTTTLRQILEGPQDETIEGYVFHYPDLDDFRIKFKYDWYLDMHKLLCQLTPKCIWQMYVDSSWKEKVILLPDELQQDIDSQIAKWKGRYIEIDMQANKYFKKYKKYSEYNRSSFAMTIQQMVPQEYRGMMFKLLDEESIYELVLKLIKKEDKEGKRNLLKKS